MTIPSRQRVFGAKVTTTPCQATAQNAGLAELHHDGGKLVSWAVLSVVFSAGSFWAVAAGGVGADYRGRDLFLVEMLGPQGMIALFALCGICSALLAAAYLRLLVSGDRLAVATMPEGLAVNGIWGRKIHAWRDIETVRLHITQPRSREIVFIRIERRDDGSQMVSTNSVAGGRGEVERWVQQVQSWLHR